MKQKDLKSILKNNIYLVLIDVAFWAVTVIINKLFDEHQVTPLFTPADMYLLICFPLFFILRGVLCRIFMKQIWIPNLILFIEIWLALPIVGGSSLKEIFSISGILIALVFFLFSTILSLITGGVIRLIRRVENRRKMKQTQ